MLLGSFWIHRIVFWFYFVMWCHRTASPPSTACLFVCLFVGIKPENPYFASRPGIEVKSFEYIHSGRVALPAARSYQRYATARRYSTCQLSLTLHKLHLWTYESPTQVASSRPKIPHVWSPYVLTIEAISCLKHQHSKGVRVRERGLVEKPELFESNLFFCFMLLHHHTASPPITSNLFFVYFAATQPARQLHQEQLQVVCSNRAAQKRLARGPRTPAMDLEFRGIRTHMYMHVNRQ